MKTGLAFGGVLLAGIVLLLVGAAVWTWVIMLALGAVAHSTDNAGLAWGFWQTFPVGVLVALVMGALTRSGK